MLTSVVRGGTALYRSAGSGRSTGRIMVAAWGGVGSSQAGDGGKRVNSGGGSPVGERASRRRSGEALEGRRPRGERRKVAAAEEEGA